MTTLKEKFVNLDSMLAHLNTTEITKNQQKKNLVNLRKYEYTKSINNFESEDRIEMSNPPYKTDEFLIKVNITPETVKNPDKLFNLLDQLRIMIIRSKMMHSKLGLPPYGRDPNIDWDYSSIFCDAFMKTFDSIIKNNKNLSKRLLINYQATIYKKYRPAYSYFLKHLKNYPKELGKNTTFNKLDIPKHGSNIILNDLFHINNSIEIRPALEIVEERNKNLEMFKECYKNFTKEEIIEYFTLSSTLLPSCKSTTFNRIQKSESYENCLEKKVIYWRDLYNFLKNTKFNNNKINNNKINNNKINNNNSNKKKLIQLAEEEKNKHTTHLKNRFNKVLDNQIIKNTK